MREMAAVREELERVKQVTNELKKENENYRSELETMKQQTKGLMEKKLAEQKVRFFLFDSQVEHAELISAPT